MAESKQLLETLHGKMRVCRLCLDAGYEIYPRAIFSGKVTARMMVIGQAPGITEQKAGRPFNAGSGKRLFQWLAQAGIDETWFRTTQYMTSVTKCYPGPSKSGGGDRVPSRAEQRLCRPFLDGEISIVSPSLIIPVGRLAIGLFYPKSLKLTEIIGTSKVQEGRVIVPLPHSSGASRWHQSSDNRLLIQQAIDLIAGQVRRLFPEGIPAGVD